MKRGLCKLFASVVFFTFLNFFSVICALVGLDSCEHSFVFCLQVVCVVNVRHWNSVDPRRDDFDDQKE